ncbi:hypothetical protein NDU88_006084 [Pleurodeles waltl]|uniref:Uncharacterized protein n=1 Tax=Pleurodeles waltl TaxID=8319 RepID=A0AAV7NU39_PLEWA|nr:hypothetical protein NDU88_006084 [Pleurodeles waltl]
MTRAPRDYFSFHIFSDMSTTAAHRQRKSISLIDDFKKYGAPAGIVQLAKLKIFHSGRAHIFLDVQQAKDYLKTLRK